MNQFFGKYRAVVVEISDPLKSGRIRVACPELFGNNLSSWCLPCIPVASDDSGDFCLPSIGESVWIEFEKGNINSPIYSGGWFSPIKTPLGDYDENTPQRIISFGNVALIFSNNNLRLRVGQREIDFNARLIDTIATLSEGSPPLSIVSFRINPDTCELEMVCPADFEVPELLPDFDIDFGTGELLIHIPDGYSGPMFRLNEMTGELETCLPDSTNFFKTQEEQL